MIYVGGGNTANMLAIWRLHGVDRALRAAWEAGVVMAGMSAGGDLLVRGCTTDSFGPTLRPLHDGLGSCREPSSRTTTARRSAGRCSDRLVADGTLPGGYGVDDGAALVFRDASWPRS